MKKIIIPVALFIGCGITYAGGNYYANKIAVEKTNETITDIKKKYPMVDKITYGNIDVGFMALFNKKYSIDDLTISLKEYPENSLHLNSLKLSGLDNDGDINFNMSLQGIRVDNIQSIKNHKLANVLAYLNDNINIKYNLNQADQTFYFDINYDFENQANIDFNFSLDVANTGLFDVLKQPNEQDISQKLFLSIAKAKISKIHYSHDITEQPFKAGLDFLKGTYPQYNEIYNQISPSTDFSLDFTADNSELNIDFNMDNFDKNIISSKQVIKNLPLNSFTLEQLSILAIKKDWTSLLGKSYLGDSESNVDIKINIPASLINEMYPVAESFLKDAGISSFTPFIKSNENYSTATKKNTVSLNFGLQKQVDLKINTDTTITNPTLLKDLVKNLLESFKDKNSDNNLTLESLGINDNEIFNELAIKLTNKNLVDNFYKILDKTLSGNPKMYKSIATSYISTLVMGNNNKDIDNVVHGVVDFINKPKALELKFTPINKGLKTSKIASVFLKYVNIYNDNKNMDNKEFLSTLDNLYQDLEKIIKLDVIVKQ